MNYDGCTIGEIKAFRELENEVFDFGEGEMKMVGSESVYYKQSLSSFLQELSLPKEEEEKGKRNHTTRSSLNPYERKMLCKKKVEELHKVGSWWTVQNKGEYKTRCYFGRSSKHHKKASNKKVRKTQGISNGCNYRKVYEYWWQIL